MIQVALKSYQKMAHEFFIYQTKVLKIFLVNERKPWIAKQLENQRRRKNNNNKKKEREATTWEKKKCIHTYIHIYIYINILILAWLYAIFPIACFPIAHCTFGTSQ